MDPDAALFVHVVAAGSLSAAARARGISPAMVSKRIARLEARLGVRLLHRTTRRLALTPRGAVFHRDMVAVLAAIAEAEARVADTGGIAGPLVVNAPTSFGRLHLAPHLRPFLDAHPAIALRLDLTDAFLDLTAARVDLAIRVTGAPPPGVVAHRLAPSRRVLCAAPAYLAAAGRPIAIGDLARHRLLAADGQMPWRLTGTGATAIEAPSVVATDSSEVVRELAIAGVGIALRSIWDVDAELADGRLVRVLPEWRGSDDAAVYAVHLPDALPRAGEAMLTYLRRLFATPPWGNRAAP
ncbi:LysR family transcriptional regulator [Hephaestia sp. MAHUQ-44]|uniref:LysR family transcriptional regulator n=1 Tax=Hephaestia sp. MAHUQ-44 TaxID=2952526 RepID=UPI0020777ECE|nr:LysR family transcriptional regulator [Hephaestia sp. MAHUQ-44]